jgi:hypothetical protein
MHLLASKQNFNPKMHSTTQKPDRAQQEKSACVSSKTAQAPEAKAIATIRMWKTRQPTRIKPVIAGDTTYGVSPLTGPTGGSNVAIPSRKFHLTGMGWN